MSYPIQCSGCNYQFTVSDNVFRKRIAGKTFDITCQHCGASITVDGRPKKAFQAPPQRTNLGLGLTAVARSAAVADVAQSPGATAAAQPAELAAVAKPAPSTDAAYQPRPQRTNLGLGLLPFPRPAGVPTFDAPAVPALAATRVASESDAVESASLEQDTSEATLKRVPARSTLDDMALVNPEREATTVREPKKGPSAAEPQPMESATTSNDELTPPPYAIGLNATSEAGEEDSVLELPIKRRSKWWMIVAAAAVVAGGVGATLVFAKGGQTAPAADAGETAKAAVKSAAQKSQKPSAPSPLLTPPKQVAAAAPSHQHAKPVTDSAASDASEVPPYVLAPQVLHLTDVMVGRAQKCHPNGRATGTADLFITFAPTGRVSEARLQGEPIASAPVGRCILEKAYAVRIRKFDGAPFTLKRAITLR